MRYIAVIFGVFLAYYGYYGVADLSSDSERMARWWFYIYRGVCGVVIFYILIEVFSERKGILPMLAVYACMVGFLQEAECAVCGMATIGNDKLISIWSGLCLDKFGKGPYLLGLALALTVMLKGHKKDETRKH